jgi:hypothetical protein
LEGLALAFKASVTVNFGTEGTISELPDGLFHVVVPHIVSIEESKNVSGDERGRDVDINHGRGMNLAVISGPVK